MIARIRKSMEEKDQGFTLVELLVVVIIIGILAAIAIPMFLRQRERAWAASVESDLKNASIAAETYAIDNDGSYAGMTMAILNDAGYNATDGVTLTITSADAAGYTLSGVHVNLGGDTWTYDSDTGVITGP